MQAVVSRGKFCLSDEALELYNSKIKKIGLEKVFTHEDMNYTVRWDPILVKVVKNLGNKANGPGCELKFQHVNNYAMGGYDIEIRDGLEVIVENPREGNSILEQAMLHNFELNFKRKTNEVVVLFEQLSEILTDLENRNIINPLINTYLDTLVNAHSNVKSLEDLDEYKIKLIDTLDAMRKLE